MCFIFRVVYHTRLKPSGLLFHSDQVTHYTSKKFAESVNHCDIMIQSMSRKVNCWDNTPTERFFKNFKIEWLPKGGYEDISEAIQAIIDYIWGYYQSLKPQTFNDYLSTAEKDKLHFNRKLLSGFLN